MENSSRSFQIKEMAYMSNGHYHKLFHIKRQRNGFARYICTVCRVLCNSSDPFKDTEEMVETHLNSKLHNDSIALQKIVIINEHIFKAEVPEDSSSESSNDQEENEDESKLVFNESAGTTLESILQMKQIPVTGVEYLISFLDVSYCFLCDYKTNKDMTPHIKGLKHQTKYLRIHFPTILDFISKVFQRIKHENVKYISQNQTRLDLLEHAALTICKKFGSMPLKYEQGRFEPEHKRIYMQRIAYEGHFNERDAPSVSEDFCDNYVKMRMVETVNKLFQAPECAKIDLRKGNKSPELSGKSKMNELNEEDFKILLENFHNIPIQDQTQLRGYIKLAKPETLFHLRGVLNDEGLIQLERALKG